MYFSRSWKIMMKNKEIKKNKQVVTIVGIGYVGLPLACLCGMKGFRTYGIAKEKHKINLINRGISPIQGDEELSKWVAKKLFTATASYDSIKKSDVIIVCVPTPVDDKYNPDLGPIQQVCKRIAKDLKKGQLVIIESTVNPGVCEEVVQPILEKGSGLKAGKDFYIAHSPERIDPGNTKWNVVNIPRCVGALSKKGLALAVKFYRHILDGDVRPMKSIKEAEATKIIENSFRDINIAFVNELAKSFEVLGIDLIDVIEGAKTKPFAFMAHYPSSGVGGHCIPVDPYYLIERARLSGFDHQLLKLARRINNSMPAYTVELLIKALNEIKRPIKGTKVGVLGLSYKANIGDLRESPSLEIIDILNDEGARVEIYDPYFPSRSTAKNLKALFNKVDVVLIATDHNEFKEMPLSWLRQGGIKVVVDGKNCFNKEGVENLNIIYRGIGR